MDRHGRLYPRPALPAERSEYRVRKDRLLLRLWRSHEQHRVAPRLLGWERYVHPERGNSQRFWPLSRSWFILQGSFPIDGSIEALDVQDHRSSGNEQACRQNKGSREVLKALILAILRGEFRNPNFLATTLLWTPERYPWLGLWHTLSWFSPTPQTLLYGLGGERETPADQVP